MIRRAVSSDVPDLLRVINAAYVVEQFFKAGDRIDRAGVTERLDRGTFLVETDEAGTVAGCVYVEIQVGGRGYFGLLSVDPARQGGGLGRRLVEAAEAHCRAAGCREIDLRVVNLRTELPPFYRRLGYVATGTEAYVDNDATQPCHFVVMSKAL
jgi:GNAT superfamily N-acetyltransferase